jgi:oxalate decarboxylase
MKRNYLINKGFPMKGVLTSKLYFKLEEVAPLSQNELGSLIAVTAEDVPGFFNISFASVELNPHACLAPIWHPNAHKIGYCTQGKVHITMRTPTKIEKFTVQKGEMFFIPMGFVHSIENIDGQKSVVKCALNHEFPEIMHLNQAVDSISDSVFTSTFTSKQGFVHGLKNLKNGDMIIELKQKVQAPSQSESSYKFNIEGSDKPILTKGGYLQIGTKKNLPALEGLALLGFRLNQKGAVEPHWHTNAGELVYIVRGKTRITVLAPDGNVETVEVNGGEGIFAPASHFHNIENVGTESVEVIAFFNNAEPDYIGIGEAVGVCSNDMLAAAFNVDSSYFEGFNKPEGPLVIVPVK